MYAIEGGRAQVRGMTVSIFPKRGGHQLSYWHIVPTVRASSVEDAADRRIAPGAEHVHLGEYRDETYVNPLRLGGLAPYIDDTVPQLPKLTFYSLGNPVPPENLSGFVDVTVDAFDPSPLPAPPEPWAGARLAPAFIRWRVVVGPTTVRPWERAVDFRLYLLPLPLFGSCASTPRGRSRTKPAGRGATSST